MSKKSRKRNKKILGALAALGTGLALANRGKGMEMSNIEVDSGRGGDSSSAAARVVANNAPVYRDAIMRGASGVKNMRKIPGIVVDKPIGSFPFLGLKKGGRVKKGFAKKKKQANKMRKK
tara:strand:+ start:210 stop:569 length:360 start_codon:yes stop_codon:yes gene_type:complete